MQCIETSHLENQLQRTARTLHNNVTHKKMQISANMQTYMCACACVCAVYVSDYEITISSTHTLPSTLGVGCIVPISMLCCRSHKRKVSMFMANKMFFQQFNEADIYFFSRSFRRHVNKNCSWRQISTNRQITITCMHTNKNFTEKMHICQITAIDVRHHLKFDVRCEIQRYFFVVISAYAIYKHHHFEPRTQTLPGLIFPILRQCMHTPSAPQQHNEKYTITHSKILNTICIINFTHPNVVPNSLFSIERNEQIDA